MVPCVARASRGSRTAAPIRIPEPRRPQQTTTSSSFPMARALGSSLRYFALLFSAPALFFLPFLPSSLLPSALGKQQRCDHVTGKKSAQKSDPGLQKDVQYFGDNEHGKRILWLRFGQGQQLLLDIDLPLAGHSGNTLLVRHRWQPFYSAYVVEQYIY